jgi:hypothetical protein
MNVEMKRGRWKYLGNVVKMENVSIVKRSVKWIPEPEDHTEYRREL